jgi:hypothetical protein
VEGWGRAGANRLGLGAHNLGGLSTAGASSAGPSWVGPDSALSSQQRSGRLGLGSGDWAAGANRERFGRLGLIRLGHARLAGRTRSRLARLGSTSLARLDRAALTGLDSTRTGSTGRRARACPLPTNKTADPSASGPARPSHPANGSEPEPCDYPDQRG